MRLQTLNGLNNLAGYIVTWALTGIAALGIGGLFYVLIVLMMAAIP